MKTKKPSITTKVTNYLLLIIIFATIISISSLAIMLSNKSDAELMNISGSLRMQSYRILYEMVYEPQFVTTNLQQYRSTLYSPTLTELNHQFFIPTDVKQAYKALIERWGEMENYAKQMNYQAYQKEVPHYVDQIDEFVNSL